MDEVELDQVVKSYDGIKVLEQLCLGIANRELLVVVGPSGGGKTTTLRLIAGLEQPSSGSVHIGGRDVTTESPAGRGVSMLFQRPVLYPSRSVRDNLLAYKGLHTPSKLGDERPALHIPVVAERLGLNGLLERYPRQLSGGQQQRVALARTLIRPARVYLLDEPLSHLDAPLRVDLRRQLHLLHRQFPATMMIVTHDPVEALALGDRVAVLDAGKV